VLQRTGERRSPCATRQKISGACPKCCMLQRGPYPRVWPSEAHQEHQNGARSGPGLPGPHESERRRWSTAPPRRALSPCRRPTNSSGRPFSFPGGQTAHLGNRLPQTKSKLRATRPSGAATTIEEHQGRESGPCSAVQRCSGEFESRSWHIIMAWLASTHHPWPPPRRDQKGTWSKANGGWRRQHQTAAIAPRGLANGGEYE
jgi:hypothetical protein